MKTSQLFAAVRILITIMAMITAVFTPTASGSTRSSLVIQTGPSTVGRRDAGIEPWKKWADDPLTITVALDATLQADANAPSRVTLSDTVLQSVGQGCDTPTNPPARYAHLKVYHPYTLTVTGLLSS